MFNDSYLLFKILDEIVEFITSNISLPLAAELMPRVPILQQAITLALEFFVGIAEAETRK